jgi:lysophosphatidylcholine acyltransferase/lyso-PAF acetyltransferase
MVFIGLILLPIRGIVLLVSFFFFWLTAFIGSACMPDVRAVQFPQTKPVSRFFMRVFGRLILWSLGYWWISVDGEFDSRARVIVSNHCSFIDPFFFTYALLPMAVAKAELFGVPMLGSIAKIVQAIPVSRGTAESRHDVSHEIKRRTQWGLPKKLSTPQQHAENTPTQQKEAVEEETGTWPPLLIFPEATCTNSRSVIQFKMGAFAPLVPVQPVALDFRQDYLDVSWPGDAPVGMTILRMMCQLYNRLHVTVLPLAEPAASETVPEFAGRVQSGIAKALGVPVTRHSFVPPPRPPSARTGRNGQQSSQSAQPSQDQQSSQSAQENQQRAVEVGPAAATEQQDDSSRTTAVAAQQGAMPYGAEQPPADDAEEGVALDETIPELVRSCSLVP